MMLVNGRHYCITYLHVVIYKASKQKYQYSMFCAKVISLIPIYVFVDNLFKTFYNSYCWKLYKNPLWLITKRFLLNINRRFIPRMTLRFVLWLVMSVVDCLRTIHNTEVHALWCFSRFELPINDGSWFVWY